MSNRKPPKKSPPKTATPISSTETVNRDAQRSARPTTKPPKKPRSPAGTRGPKIRTSPRGRSGANTTATPTTWSTDPAAYIPPAADPSAYYFDAAAADRACEFFPRFLTHVRGELGGKPFELADWQKHQLIRPLFGWKRRADGFRRFREAYLELPRGNGKTTLIIGIGYLLLFGDREPGAEVYSAAADLGQARIAFELALEMRLRSPALADRSEAFKNAILAPRTASAWRALSGEAFNKHGFNAHGVLIDEFHAQPNRELYDVLRTATVKRRQPLTVLITTAGYDRQSICWELHEYARQIKDGTRQDDTFFPLIYAADEGDDWTAEATWKKANPGYGVSVMPDYLRQECAKAQQSPRAENTFRQLHLNQWTEQQTRWIPMEKWRKCGELPVDLAALAGRPCYGGLDLASTTDLSALALIFPPLPGETNTPFRLLYRYWLPQENMRDRGKRDRFDYERWTREGFIKTTPGNEIDDAQIVADILELAARYQIKEIAFDRFGARLIRRTLEDAGLSMTDFGQGFVSMSPPSRDLEKLILTEQLAHGNNPVTTWMADNVAVIRDPAGNIKPAKDKSSARIDGIVATIMALGRCAAAPAHQSVYELRGITLL